MVHEFVLAVESNNFAAVSRLISEGVDVRMEMDRAVRYCTDHAILELLASNGADLLAFGFQTINITSTGDVKRADVLIRYHPHLLRSLIRSAEIACHFIKTYSHCIIQIIDETISPWKVYDTLISIGYNDDDGWRRLARRAGYWNDWETFKKIPSIYQSGMGVTHVSGDARILTTLLDNGHITVTPALCEYVMSHGYTEFMSVILDKHGYVNFRPSTNALIGVISRWHYPSICLYLFSEVSWNNWMVVPNNGDMMELMSVRMARYGISATSKGDIADDYWMEGLRVSRKSVRRGMPWAFTRDLHMDPVPEKMKYTHHLTDISVVTCIGENIIEKPRKQQVKHHLPEPLTVDMLLKAYKIIGDDAARVRGSTIATPVSEPPPVSKRKRGN